MYVCMLCEGGADGQRLSNKMDVIFDAPLILNFSFTQTIYLSSSIWEKPELHLTTNKRLLKT